MIRTCFAVVAFALLLLAPLHGQEITGDSDLHLFKLFQAATERAISRAESSIACILVSRSDKYRTYNLSQGPEESGILGGLSKNDLDNVENVERSRLSSPKIKQLLVQLDLAHLAHIPEAFGSGVVLDVKGLVLTNFHVVRDATKVYVRLPGGKGSYADIYAADPRSDLAVLKLLDPPPLQTLRLGDGGSAKRGQFVIALANPFAAGFSDGQPSASLGMIANVRRRLPGPTSEMEWVKSLHQYGTLLQVDTRLSLGSSGGALLNLDGELIGLTSSIAAVQGIDSPGGYAIPFDDATKRIVNVLLRGEEVEYGFLGVIMPVVEAPISSPPGVRIDFPLQGSPADRDGKLTAGDVLTAVNGVPLRTNDDLYLNIGTSLAGTRVSIDFLRENKRDNRWEQKTTHVTLGRSFVPAKSISSNPGKRPFVRGFRVDDTTLVPQQQQAQRTLNVPVGVLVTEVLPDSDAARAQLRPGDIITVVNGQNVRSPVDFYRITADITGEINLTLRSNENNAEPPRIRLK